MLDIEEFEKNNPVICGDGFIHLITKEDFLTQANFFSTHKFIFKTLDEFESKLLKLRYGIGYDAPMAYVDMVKELGLTMENLKQAELKAVRKLRHPSRIKLLRTYTDENFDEILLQRYAVKDYPKNFIHM